MASKTDAPPLPWRFNRDLLTIDAADGSIALCVDGECCPESLDPEFVVRAVNSHDRLLEALRHVCDVFGPINDSVGGLGALVAARAAIAAAEGK